jgi:hypothetical protein
MKKMILVPSELTSPTKAVDQILHNLDSEMMNILQKEDIPADVKLKQYNQILSRYSSLQDFKRQPYKLDVIDPDDCKITDEEILHGIPDKNKKTAKALLNFVKKGSNILIEKNGEITVNGNRVKGSNIVDLIHDLSRDRKTSKIPKGFQELIRGLKASNLPLEYVVNRKRRNMFVEPLESDNEEYFDTSHVDENSIGVWRE